MRRAIRMAALATVATLLGCREHSTAALRRADRPAASTAAPAASASGFGALSASEPSVGRAAADAGVRLAPLEAASSIVALAVEGFADAMVAVPIGSREPRGLIVALHGNYDRPEWACESWRAVVGPDPFILCLRGNERADSPPGDARFTYPGATAAGKELRAARVALTARFADRLLDAPAVYAGFSLGAILGVAIAAHGPALYPRLVLVEGGHDAWNAATARQFRQGGGERVLFVCSQRSCLGTARAAAKLLGTAGVLTEIVDAGAHGHRYDGPVAEATRSRWGWLREGLPGFAAH